MGDCDRLPTTGRCRPYGVYNTQRPRIASIETIPVLILDSNEVSNKLAIVYACHRMIICDTFQYETRNLRSGFAVARFALGSDKWQLKTTWLCF